MVPPIVNTQPNLVKWTAQHPVGEDDILVSPTLKDRKTKITGRYGGPLKKQKKKIRRERNLHFIFLSLETGGNINQVVTFVTPTQGAALDVL